MSETTNSNLKQTYICKLKDPATCKHKVDGKFSRVNLCGANPLGEDFRACHYKEIGEIVIKEFENDQN